MLRLSTSFVAVVLFLLSTAAAAPKVIDVTQAGVVGDDTTLNTTSKNVTSE